jgi:flagellar hook assembly protein FlgD
LRIYDAQGRLVRRFAVSRAMQTIWDGRDDMGQLLPSGTYLVRCDAAGTHATARLILQR